MHITYEIVQSISGITSSAEHRAKKEEVIIHHQEKDHFLII